MSEPIKLTERQFQVLKGWIRALAVVREQRPPGFTEEMEQLAREVFGLATKPESE